MGPPLGGIKNPIDTACILIATHREQSINVGIGWVGLWSLLTFLLSFVLTFPYQAGYANWNVLILPVYLCFIG